MRNLLSANMRRLMRSRIFWLIEIGIFLWGSIVYILCNINTKNGYLMDNGNVYFFNEMTFIGIVIACYSGFFIGTDYSDGTIRNKVAVGHNRKNIYLANLITILFVGIMQLLAYKLAACTIGYLIVGEKVFTTLYKPFKSIVISVLSICGSVTIATFLSMTIMDKAKAVLVNVFFSILILAAGTAAIKSLLQPETIKIYHESTIEQTQSTQKMEDNDNFLYVEEVPNPKYLTGMERSFYEFAASVLPGAQALGCAITENKFQMLSIKHILNTTLLVIIVTVGGAFIFTRRDIK